MRGDRRLMWLALTPEPERELPAAVAALRGAPNRGTRLIRALPGLEGTAPPERGVRRVRGLVRGAAARGEDADDDAQRERRRRIGRSVTRGQAALGDEAERERRGNERPRRALPGMDGTVPPDRQVRGLPRGAAGLGDAAEWERRRIERLVLRGTQRGWLRYLAEVAALVSRAAADPAADAGAALTAAEVVLEHHRMLIGLPGRGYAAAAGTRADVERAMAVLRARIDAESGRAA